MQKGTARLWIRPSSLDSIYRFTFASSERPGRYMEAPGQDQRGDRPAGEEGAGGVAAEAAESLHWRTSQRLSGSDGEMVRAHESYLYHSSGFLLHGFPSVTLNNAAKLGKRFVLMFLMLESQTCEDHCYCMKTVIVSVLFLRRFTRVAACLFQVREFLGKLDELVGKVSYANDPIKLRKPALQQRTERLLHDLIKRSPVFGHTLDPPLLLGDGLLNDLLFFILFPLSSFVVETQPSMPQGKGPLVLRTNVQFSVKTRSVRNCRPAGVTNNVQKTNNLQKKHKLFPDG